MSKVTLLRQSKASKKVYYFHGFVFLEFVGVREYQIQMILAWGIGVERRRENVQKLYYRHSVFNF